MDRLDEDDGFELTAFGPDDVGLRYGIGFIANARGKYKRLRARLLVGGRPSPRRHFSFYIAVGKPLRWCGQRPPSIRRQDVKELQEFVAKNLLAIIDHWDLKDDSPDLICRLKCRRRRRRFGARKCLQAALLAD